MNFRTGSSYGCGDLPSWPAGSTRSGRKGRYPAPSAAKLRACLLLLIVIERFGREDFRGALLAASRSSMTVVERNPCHSLEQPQKRGPSAIWPEADCGKEVRPD